MTEREDDNLSKTGPNSVTTMELPLPEGVSEMLYQHQREGLSWLWALHCSATGGILGDDMGLGKTMQVSAFLAGLYHSSLTKRALIVAPKTVLTHWINELSVVGLKDKIRDYSSTSVNDRSYQLQYTFKEGGVLLTTYDIVRKDYMLIRGSNADDAEEEILWDYVILDEGHIIKNPKTQRAQSLFEIPSAHRIVITGTPIQNNLKEMWALFYFCCPHVLGDKDEFKVKYEKAILRGNDKNATDQEKQMGSNAAKELRERIKPYFLRRLKSEVFINSGAEEDKRPPQKNELIIWLKLTSCQRQLYEAFLNSEVVHSRTEALKGSSLETITILKKICDHPLLLTKRAAEDVLEEMGTTLNNQDMCVVERILDTKVHADNTLQVAQDVSCKIAFILPLLRNLVEEGHNVLIFSQTRRMLSLIQEAISLEDHKFLRIDGTTKVSERMKILKDFQEGLGAPILLLTSQVGGLGNGLTKADRVIVVDPAWNPSTDDQSVDRAYRIGQTKDVIVYRLMTCGTIEEKIYKLQVFKGGLFRTAMEHKEQTHYFSQEDIHELFRLPPQGFDVSLTQHQLEEEHGQQLVKDESLRKHIRFLEQQGVAGVSHHSLLFCKTDIMPTLDDNDALDRKPKDIMVRRCYADKGAYSPGLEHRNADRASLMESRDAEMLFKIKTERAAGVKEMRKKMEDLEDIRSQITKLEQEYVSEFVEMLDRTSRNWERSHLQKVRMQINDLHQEHTAGFDEMVGKMRMEMMDGEEFISEFDEMVEKMRQRIQLDQELVMSLRLF